MMVWRANFLGWPHHGQDPAARPSQCFGPFPRSGCLKALGTLVAPRGQSWLEKGGISLIGEGKKSEW